MNGIRKFSSAAVLVAACAVVGVGAIAAQPVPLRTVQELAPDAADTPVLNRAIRLVPLSSGSLFAIQAETDSWDTKAVTGRLLRQDGSQRPFLAVSYVQPGVNGQIARPAAGTAGQVYAVAMFQDGDTLAMSIGWSDEAGESHNAIAIVSLTHGQRNLIEMPGTVRDLSAGPGDLLLAVTYLPSRASRETGTPMLTILDTRGSVHGEAFPLPVDADTRTIGDAVHKSRLVQSRNGGFALYDQPRRRLVLFSIKTSPGELGRQPLPSMLLERMGNWPVPASFSQRLDAAISVDRTVSLAERKTPTDSVLGIHVEKDGTIAMVANARGDAHTRITRFAQDGSSPSEWISATPWQSMYWENDEPIGVTQQGETAILEGISFRDAGPQVQKLKQTENN